MIKATNIPEELVSGTGKNDNGRLWKPMAKTRTLEGIDEIQHLYVAPLTSIKMHGHDKQWEVWLDIAQKNAYVCLIDETHELVNNSAAMRILMAIKGHINYPYDDLAGLLYSWGFHVIHGSLVINE